MESIPNSGGSKVLLDAPQLIGISVKLTWVENVREKNQVSRALLANEVDVLKKDAISSLGFGHFLW